MTNFKPNENFKYYMYFISERMNIFWRRYEGQEAPYTEDKILQEHKFTNVYRVLDRSSQYLLKNVIYNGKQYSREDMFWRIMIYKHFNLPKTWDLLSEEFGDITLDITNHDICKFLKGLDITLYSNAYMLTAAFMKGEETKKKFGLKSGMPKYELYLRIFEQDVLDNGRIFKILDSKSTEECFNQFMGICSFADFLSYQLVQDLNYTDFMNFDDNEFCAAGPGTQRGVDRCFTIEGKPDYPVIVKWVQQNFEQLCEDYHIDFKPLPNWKPKVPDFSNCFCETFKYLKGINPGTESGEKRIKQLFRPLNDKIRLVFPPKWNVNL